MGYQNDNTELEMFKRLDLHQIIQQLGWKLDTNARGRGKGSATYTNGGDSVVVFQGSNGVWLAKNYATGRTVTVVDLAKDFAGGSLGEARKILRSLSGSATSPAQTAPHHSSSTRPNTAPEKLYKTPYEVKQEYAGMGDRWHYGDRVPDYLRDRAFDDLPAVFDGSFRVDEKRFGNVCFPYRALDEASGQYQLCGVERKNHDFKGYTDGGKSGFWIAQGDEGGAVVLCESPIDAMSFDVISGEADAERFAHGLQPTYVAVRSGAEAEVVEFLKSWYLKFGTPRIYCAFDNDAAGAAYAMKIMAGLSQVKPIRARMVMPPLDSTDWNEAHMKRAAAAKQHPAENDSFEPAW